MDPDPHLTLAWAAIILFAVFAYVVMDGFDLGIGILFPSFAEGEERDRAMNSIAPVWDGNETWLVLGGGGLLAAFPVAYGVIMTALYPVIIAMLLALVFRGVAFEARWRDPSHRRWWDRAFAGGSFVAAFSQGVVLGALVQGIEVADRAYAGGRLDWLTPFSLLTGACVVVGYALLGATWLVWKTEGSTQQRAHGHARRFAVLLLAGIMAVSLATLGLEFDYHRRWLSYPAVLLTAQVPLLTGLAGYWLFRALQGRREGLPFLLSLALFLLTFTGLSISLFPYVVPQSLDIWQAATSARSQRFLLIGTVFLVPVIVAYTAWSYWVFRGKVAHDGYH